MGADILRRRPLHHLEVAQSRKFNGKILQRLGGLVDEKHVEDNVELMNLPVLVHAFWPLPAMVLLVFSYLDVGFSVHRIRETRKLYNTAEF